MSVPAFLNAPLRAERLSALRDAVADNRYGINDVSPGREVNNHVHTIYSFSPYSPAAAVWMARRAGLQAVGSVDHDSIAAAPETIEACRIIGIGSTVGCEVRVRFSGTAVEGRKINNPDGPNVAYIVLHGVPLPRIPDVDRFLAPIRAVRNRRNEAQTLAMSRLLEERGAPPVAYRDVVAASCAAEGGSITERHILAVASRALIGWLGAGKRLRLWVESALTGELSPRVAALLDDEANEHYVYDLLGALKSGFLPQFYLQPEEAECPQVADAVDFANSIQAIPAYAYLGDIEDSPTGDKKAERFEDSYLDLLFGELSRIGFRAVTYMPPRNTVAQLLRVQRLCAEHGLMEISGVDINSSRQSFTCPEILQPEFEHLTDSTWALIAHEKLTAVEPSLSLFAADNPAPGPPAARLARYAEIGRALDVADPAGSAEHAAGKLTG